MVSKSFVDKYRPNNLERIVGNVQAINDLKAIEGKPPHMLFSGFQGTGKTTAAYALCRKLLGEKWRSDVLELNSSMDRGIEVIRKRIRQFASTKSLLGGFKIVILDEADNMTKDAQHALRGTMEQYADTTSFLLTCNYPEKIIAPIRSRCRVFNFEPISIDQTQKLIGQIVIAEKMIMEPAVAERLAERARGDMRQVLYDLEFLKKLGREIILDDVKSLPVEEIEEIAKMVLTGDAKQFAGVKNNMLKAIKAGINPDDILTVIQQMTLDTGMPATKKFSILVAIAETQRNMALSTTREIQLIGLLAKIMLVLK
jgi:replication factor C small subunit